MRCCHLHNLKSTSEKMRLTNEIHATPPSPRPQLAEACWAAFFYMQNPVSIISCDMQGVYLPIGVPPPSKPVKHHTCQMNDTNTEWMKLDEEHKANLLLILGK